MSCFVHFKPLINYRSSIQHMFIIQRLGGYVRRIKSLWPDYATYGDLFQISRQTNEQRMKSPTSGTWTFRKLTPHSQWLHFLSRGLSLCGDGVKTSFLHHLTWKKIVLVDQVSSLYPRRAQLPESWFYFIIYFLSFLLDGMFHKIDFYTHSCLSLASCDIAWTVSKQEKCICDNPRGCTSEMRTSG